MVYEVKVTVNKPGTTSKTIKTPFALTFVIRSDSEINAKIEALNCAKRTQAAHPKIYKGCTFIALRDDVKQFK